MTLTTPLGALRPFQPDDLGLLHSLIHRTMDVSYTPLYPPQALEYFKAIHSPRSILKDAVEGTTLVAPYAQGIAATGSRVGSYIKRVFVHPDLQRRGLGKRIMAALETDALHAGKTVVRLDASLASREFYLACGYRIQREAFVPLESGQRLDYTIMDKPLINPDAAETSLHNRFFRLLSSRVANDLGPDTLFHYYQEGAVVRAFYQGGAVAYGMLLGQVDDQGRLHAHSQHITHAQLVVLGQCVSTLERLPDRRLRLHQEWTWADGEPESLLAEELAGL